MYFMGEFAQKKKKKKVIPIDAVKAVNKREPRKVNAWEKAREIRSGIGTAQRVSQDIRGWLSYAKALRG